MFLFLLQRFLDSAPSISGPKPTEQRFLYPYPSMVLGFPTITSMEACRLLPNPDASPKNGKPLERPLLNRGFPRLKIHIGCPAWWRMPIVTVCWKAEARGWLELWLELQANLETGQCSETTKTALKLLKMLS